LRHGRVAWREPHGQLHTEVLKPRDLEARNHEEFLIADDSNGQQRKLRLDYIEAAVAV